MRTATWLPGLFVALALGACARPATEPASAPVATAQPVEAPAANPALTYAVLDNPDSDSPFRWLRVEVGTARTRVIDGALWAPALPMIAVLRPQAAVVGVDADGTLRVDGKALAVPVRSIDGETWTDTAALAAALGGYARRHPDDGSVVLWPASTLQWLAEHGDAQAPVLLEARAAGIEVAGGAPAPESPIKNLPMPPTGTHLRIRNQGPADAGALRVQFPHGQVDFGDVPAGSTSRFVPVPQGVYGYGAYRLQLDGRAVDVPVIDWVGESPLAEGAYTYVIAVDPDADLPVTLVRVDRNR